jgi:autotransporter-associated beta strand protein
MIKRRKQFLSFAAIAAIVALSGAAWAGISKGMLNSDNVDVDLSEPTIYEGGSAVKPVKLGSNLVNLTQNLKLGHSGVDGYAQQPLALATETEAGGAIFVGEGQTLNITPVSGKSVNGSLSPQSSLRLFGLGTTNLSGSANNYSVTFIQSGRLNVSSVEALGGSEVTLAGGSVFGIVNGAGILDLTGLTIKMTRYDPSGSQVKSVTFDTGASASNVIELDKLFQTTRYSSAVGTGDDIELIKDGLGTLSIAGVAEHSGGTVINAGTLELKSAPKVTQVIEISGDAALESYTNLLANITVKPHSGATLSVPAIRADAALTSYETGEAALRLAGIDKTALSSQPFLLKANLDGLKKPAGADAENYYVKLLNSPSHGLTANDVTVAGKVPDGFSPYYYRVSTHVDGDNVYALLKRDNAVYNNIFKVDVYNNGTEQGNILTVVVANKSVEPFESQTGFKYRFIGSAYDSSANDPVRSAVFVASKVQYNAARTKASFQIDLNGLTDENGMRHALLPGKSYEISITGTGDAAGSTGLSTVLVDSVGNVAEPGTSKHTVALEVSADLTARTIKPEVTIYVDGKLPPSSEGIIVFFNLCDVFGDPVKISGVQTERTAYASGGRATETFEKVPAGRYVVKVSSPEFSAVKYSGEIVIPGSGGGGSGCDAGTGLYGIAALCAALAMALRRRK